MAASSVLNVDWTRYARMIKMGMETIKLVMYQADRTNTCRNISFPDFFFGCDFLENLFCKFLAKDKTSTVVLRRGVVSVELLLVLCVSIDIFFLVIPFCTLLLLLTHKSGQ